MESKHIKMLTHIIAIPRTLIFISQGHASRPLSKSMLCNASLCPAV